MENFGFNELPKEPDLFNGYFRGLFPNIAAESTIINYYEEVFQPSEPVLEDSINYTFYVPKKPTNTWTNLSQSMINIGLKFEKYHKGDSKWVPVLMNDKSAPCSNICQAFWSDVDIRLNQTRVTNNRHNSQISSILSKLSSSPFYENTLGRLSGVADDITDPDKYSEENAGFKLRQEIFCKENDDSSIMADIVHLRSPLYSSISSNPWPIPSEIEISISMTRNKNELLITQNDKDKADIFRLSLIYIELVIPRIIIDPILNDKIENELRKKSIELVYNRIEVRSFCIGPGQLSYESPSLFQGYDIVSHNIMYNFLMNSFLIATNFFDIFSKSKQSSREL